MTPIVNLLRSALRLATTCGGCVLILASAAPAYGQTDPAPKPPKLRFVFLDESAGEYFVKLSKEEIQISTNPFELSAPFTPASFDRLDLYKKSPQPDPVTGEPVSTRIASLTPPKDTPSVLVVVTPRPPVDASSAPVYDVELIDCNPARFPPGAVHIINRGQATLAAKFSASEVVVPPGGAQVIRPQMDHRNRSFFKIAIEVQRNGGWQLLQDSLVVIRPQERMIGLLVYSATGMKHLMTPAELREFGLPKPDHFWLTTTDSP